MTRLNIKLLSIAGGIAAFTLALFIAAVIAGKPVAHIPPPTVEVTLDGYTDGIYRVGVDIHTGTYETVDLSPYGSCYWELRTDAYTGLDAIIANDTGDGHMRVEIPEEATGRFLRFKNGCRWVRTGPA